MTIFGPSRERFLREAKQYDQKAMELAKVADTLKLTLIALEKQHTMSQQKAA